MLITYPVKLGWDFQSGCRAILSFQRMHMTRSEAHR